MCENKFYFINPQEQEILAGWDAYGQNGLILMAEEEGKDSLSEKPTMFEGYAVIQIFHTHKN